MLPAMQKLQLRTDDDREAALEIILLLADAEARWRQYERALDLLEEAEDAGCVLSPEYRMKRYHWDRALASA